MILNAQYCYHIGYALILQFLFIYQHQTIEIEWSFLLFLHSSYHCCHMLT